MSELTTFIPAGGLGSRLNPHTLRTPKPLLPMGSADKRIIDFPLELSAQASEHTFVSIDYLGGQFESYLDGKEDLTVLCDSETLGSGGSLVSHFDEVSRSDGDGDLLILPSDHIYSGLSLVDFWDKHREDEADITLLTVPPKAYGEYVSVEDGRPASVEKVAGEGDLSTTGIFILRNQFLRDWIKKARAGREGNVPCNIYHDIICPSVGNYAVSHFFLDYPGFWEDTGTHARYLASNMRLSLGETVVAGSAQVEETASLERCVVLPDTVVEDSVHLEDTIISSSQDNNLLLLSAA